MKTHAARPGSRYGLLVPRHDGPAPVAALARILEDALLQKQLGERVRAAVAQHYSTKAICGRLAAIYKDLARTR